MKKVSFTLILLLLLRDLLISWPFSCSTGQLKADGGSSESSLQLGFRHEDPRTSLMSMGGSQSNSHNDGKVDILKF